ncbi:MAG: guanosine-3',5'-bis(diphosphate) 3'-pyrophosphohydrolase [Cellvibrionaceae bacterium]|jgi:guanosine-3',5'-bis(diphosphate) 3'-pyrophosphohydrolase
MITRIPIHNDGSPFEDSLPDGETLFSMLSYLPRQDIDEIRDAFELARKEHGDARRKSGEPFICHPLTIASYLAEYYADSPTLIAALLHDVAEDADVTIQDITHQYGSEVGRIVEGVTKFDKVTGQARLGRELSKQELNTATHYKLFETMMSDVRVGIVKIFDRLHNMRTIRFMPFHKQEEKARETLSVYAPLADRLGMWQIKNELETLSYEIISTTRFRQFQQALRDKSERNSRDFPDLIEDLTHVITKAGLEIVQIVESPEDVSGAFRIWEEEQEIRIISRPPQPVILLKNEIDCYTAMGHLHAAWRPVSGKFDDYISASRHNLYRSLHTTVVYNGRRVKVRIRTLEMQLESQNGVLSRWTDTRNMPIWARQTEQKVDKMFNQFQEAYEGGDEGEFDEKVQSILDDVFNNQITVFTPNGDEKELPRGATPVDFAYRVHTEVGHACRGALVNSERQPLTYELQDGDSVLIEKETEKSKSHPQLAWLDEDLGYIRTRTGRRGTKHWFKRLSSKMACKIGRSMVENELWILNQPKRPFAEVCKILNFNTSKELFTALGRTELSISEFSNRMLTWLWEEEAYTDCDYRNENLSSQAVFSADDEMFVIEQTGDRELQLCEICNPRPGDPIVGAILQENFVTIHADGCRLLTPDAMRGGNALQLRWGVETDKETRAITMRVYAHDRDGLLNDITSLFMEDEININFLWSKTEQFKALIIFSADIREAAQVIRFLHKVHDLKNVIHADYMGQTQLDHIIPEKFFAENPDFNFQGLENLFISEINRSDEEKK